MSSASKQTKRAPRGKASAAENVKLAPPTSPTEAFQQTILRIRDVLRHPSVSVTGMNSLWTICLYLANRYIDKEKAATLKIPEKLSWEAMLDQARKASGGVQLAFDSFFHDHDDCFVDHLDRLFKTQKLPFDIRSPQKHCEILELLAPLELDKVELKSDILGWVYEKHLSTGAAQARDLGQFFTDRAVCRYMVELCRPALKASGATESVCDPAMGTGGFLAAWRRYYEEHFPGAVEWEVQQREVFGADSDTRVAGVARLNMFLESRGAVFENLLTRDSLHEGLARTGFDVILANMPFGLKGIRYTDSCERIKALKIRGTKSEPLFLQLMMASLNPGGRCAVVVPDGVLINSTALHVETRRYLLERFDLRGVIKLKGKFFTNTSIQPSILFFENTGMATESVEFCELEKGDDGSLEETIHSTVEMCQISGNIDFSLDCRRYEERPNDGPRCDLFEKRSLADACAIVNGKNIPKAARQGKGNYPYYGSNGVSGYVDSFLYEGPCTLLGDQGSAWAKSCQWIDSGVKFYPGNHTMVITPATPTIAVKFVYYWLRLGKLADYERSGKLIPEVDKEAFKAMPIAIPPLNIQTQIVATLDRLFPSGAEINEVLKLTPRAMDLVLKEPGGILVEPIVAAARLLCKTEEMAEDVRTHARAMMRSVNNRKFERKKFSEVLAITTGKANTKRTKEAQPGSDMPYYDSNGVIGFVAEPLYKGEYTITARKLSIGAVHYFNGSFSSSDNTINFTSLDTAALLNRYFYFWLANNNDVLTALSSGIKPGIRKSDVEELTLPVPTIEFQRDMCGRLDELEKQAKYLGAQAEEFRNDAKFMLDAYLASSEESGATSRGAKLVVDQMLLNETTQGVDTTAPLEK